MRTNGNSLPTGSFYSNWRAPASQEGRQASNFVGLLNQGATCYLNSLIQALYTTPELRAGIYQLTQEELGVLQNETVVPTPPKEDRAGGHQFRFPKIQEDLITELVDMSFTPTQAKKALRATMEDGTYSVSRAIEWLFEPENNRLSFVDDDEEQEFEIPEIIEEPVEPAAPEKPKKKVRVIPAELQRLFGYLELINKNAISTRQLTESFGWHGNEIGQQHDVHELNRVLFDAIEASLRKTPQEKLLDQLYRGRLVNKVKCLSCGNISERAEDFFDITAVVKDLSSIIYSLENFVQVEKLHGDNQYFCETCNSKSDADRWVCFREMPPMLIFSLSRFEYDFDTGGRRKNTEMFHYPLSIDMQPYHESQLEFKQTAERKSARELSLHDPPIENPDSPDIYDLFAVIIHTGTSGDYGHYHAYIRDLLHQGKWEYSPDPDPEPEPLSLNPYGSMQSQSWLEKHGVLIYDRSTGLISRPEDFYSQNPGYKQTTVQNSKPTDYVEIRDETPGWFDFNDSIVKPINVNTLRSQFGGRSECAYMLIYRKRSLEAPMPSVPDFIREQVVMKNLSLQQEREDKDRLENQIRLVIHLSDYFWVDEYLIARVRDLPPEQAKDLRFSFYVDRRATLGELKQELASRFCHFEPDDQIELQSMSLLEGRLTLSRQYKPDSAKLRDSQLYNGIELLIWNGKTLSDNAAWDPNMLSISLKIKHLHTNWEQEQDPLELVFLTEDCPRIDMSESYAEIPAHFSLIHLGKLIYNHTGIPTENQRITIFSPRMTPKHMQFYEGRKPFRTFMITDYAQPESVTLERLDLDWKATLCVEWATDLHLAEIYSETKSQIVRFTVTDRLSQIEPKRVFKIIASQSIRAYDLKLKLIDIIAPGFDPDKCLFRYILSNGTSTPLQNEELCLGSCSLRAHNFNALILVEGESPSSKSIRVLFRIEGNPEQHLIELNKEWTIRRCKQAMLQSVGLEGDYLIRKTDYEGEPSHYLEQEDLTPREWGITSGKLFLLEPGKAPKPDEIIVTLKLFQYADGNPGFVWPNCCSMELQPVYQAYPEYQAQNVRFEDELPLAYSEKENSLVTAEKLESLPELSEVPDLNEPLSVENFDSLPELEQVPALGSVLDSMEAEVSNLEMENLSLSQNSNPLNQYEGKYTAEIHLAREQDAYYQTISAGAIPLDWDLFSPVMHGFYPDPPGYQFIPLPGSHTVSKALTLLEWKEYMIQSYPCLHNVPSPYHLRLWNKSKVLRDHSARIGSLIQHSGPCIIVEVLNEPEDYRNDVRCLYVFIRDSKNRRFLRPVEYHYSSANARQRGFFESVCVDFGIPFRSLYVSKYNVHNQRWTPVPSSYSDEDDENPFCDVNGIPREYCPIHLRDGEMLGVRDERQDPEEEDFAMRNYRSAGEPPIDFSNFATPYYQQRDTYPKPAYIGDSEPQRPISPRKEAELKIHVDEFGDD